MAPLFGRRTVRAMADSGFGAAPDGRSLWQDARARFQRNRAAVASLVVLALVAARLLGGLLFEVDTLDPLTFVGVPLVLAAAALLAAWLPARRASRVHPVTALRTD